MNKLVSLHTRIYTAIATMIQPMTDKMNAMHGQTVPLSFLQGMYPKAIDAVCDPRSFTTTADGTCGWICISSYQLLSCFIDLYIHPSLQTS